MKTQQILNILNVQANKYTQERAANISNIFKLLSDNKKNIQSVNVSNFGCIENFGAKIERLRSGKERILYSGFCEVESLKYTVKINFEKSTGEYNFLIPALICPQLNEVLGITTKESKEAIKSNFIKFDGDIFKEIKNALKLVQTKNRFSEYSKNILLDF